MSKPPILLVGAGGGPGLAAVVAAHLRCGGVVVLNDPRPTLAIPAQPPIPKIATVREPNPTPRGPRRPRWRRS